MKEFTVIDSFFTRKSCQRKDVIIPVGDDCAITRVPDGQQLATTTDTLISGVHFPTDSSAKSIAHKSLAVSLSDLAAMGAEPAWFSLSLSMPASDEAWLKDFSDTLHSLCEYYSIELIGGDTVQGPLVITITAQGFVPDSQAITRAGAKPGDLIYVTGTLGDAGVGLKLALEQKHQECQHSRYLRNRLDFPTPRVLAGTMLRRLATSAIDLSDGLISDIRHVLRASATGAVVHMEQLPLSDAMLSLVDANQALDYAVSAGDDYELLFTVPTEQVTNLERAMLHCNVPITCIGQMTGEAQKLQLFQNKKIWEPRVKGFEHFSQEA